MKGSPDSTAAGMGVAAQGSPAAVAAPPVTECNAVAHVLMSPFMMVMWGSECCQQRCLPCEREVDQNVLPPQRLLLQFPCWAQERSTAPDTWGPSHRCLQHHVLRPLDASLQVASPTYMQSAVLVFDAVS